MENTTEKMLVLGVGNLLLSDDGVGIHAVQALREDGWPENVHIVDGGTFTQDIFHILEGYDSLLVLDIVHCGGAPGELFLFEEADLYQDEKQRLSLHDIDLLDSLRMAGMVGKRPLMRVLGMEPKNYGDWSMELTPEAAKAFPAFLEEARRQIRLFLDGRFAEGATPAGG